MSLPRLATNLKAVGSCTAGFSRFVTIFEVALGGTAKCWIKRNGWGSLPINFQHYSISKHQPGSDPLKTFRRGPLGLAKPFRAFSIVPMPESVVTKQSTDSAVEIWNKDKEIVVQTAHGTNGKETWIQKERETKEDEKEEGRGRKAGRKRNRMKGKRNRKTK
jgi:hypothetical protein